MVKPHRTETAANLTIGIHVRETTSLDMFGLPASRRLPLSI